MTLPTSGPISMTYVRSEFGGDPQSALGEYYAGGPYVPAGTSGTYGAVPSTGQISLRDFYGTANTPALLVNVGNQTEEDFSNIDLYLNLNAVVTGGLGGHTYTWTKVSGDSSITINGSSTGSSVNIKCTTPFGELEQANATFKCTVDDGGSSDNDTAIASFIWVDEFELPKGF